MAGARNRWLNPNRRGSAHDNPVSGPESINTRELTFRDFFDLTRSTLDHRGNRGPNKVTTQRAIVAAGMITLGWIPAAFGGDTPRFDSDVLPVFKARCLVCHSGATPQARLDLSTRQSIVAGGKSGPAIIPGSSEKSLLIERISSKTMPPVEPKLTDEQISLIRLWIDKGDAASLTTEPVVLTESDVLPILQMRCIVCHGKRKQGADSI